MTIKDVTTTGGINIYRSTDVRLVNVDATAGPSYYAVWLDEASSATIESGTYTGVSKNSVLVYNKDIGNAGSSIPSKLTITGGNFTKAIGLEGDSSNGWLHVSGGYYTSDPTAYLIASKVPLVSDKAGYSFMVGNAPDNVQVVPGDSDVKEIDTAGLTGEKKELADTLNTAASTVTVAEGDTGLVTTASTVAEETEVSDTEAREALEDAGIDAPVDAAVTVVIQPKLAVSPISYDADTKELSLDIKALYDTIITTDPDNISDTNSTKIEENKKLDVKDGTPVAIHFEIPESLALVDGQMIETLTVKHVKEDGTVYYYTAAVSKGKDNKYYADFIVLHGFSTFTTMPRVTSTLTATYNLDSNNPITYSIIDVSKALPAIPSMSGYKALGWQFDGLDGYYTMLTDALWNALVGKNAGNKDVKATAIYELIPTDTETATTSSLTTSTPKTADDSSLYFYIFLMSSAILCAAGICIFRRKNGYPQ